MIDKLVQYVVEEIAMDGDEDEDTGGEVGLASSWVALSRLAGLSWMALDVGVNGTDMTRLTSFIREASSRAISFDPSSAASTSQARQVIDDAFVSYVWSVLTAQEDVHVGVLENVAETAPQLAPVQAASTSSSPKKKGKAKIEDAPPTHVMRYLDNTTLSRDELIERHGSDLRIVVGAETAWLAITGSSTRPTSLTAPVYSLLQYVSRGRGDGATVVTIGKHIGFDQKSAFHFVRVAVQLGVVKKFRTTDRGSWTNRVVHVRYLDRSKEWKIHNLNESAEDEDEIKASKGGGAEQDDDNGDALVEATGAARRMSAISHRHINTNPAMVRKRIVRALKKREGHFMPHSQIAPTIGLNHYTRKDLRRLNHLITTMAKEGVIEKLLVTDLSSRSDAQAQCVRLVVFDAYNDGEKPGRIFEFDEEQRPEDDDSPHAYTLVPLDRQMLELLAEAGAEGATCAELSIALGGYNMRTIDQTLTRLMREALVPAQMKDYCVKIMTETHGREKRSRFFTSAGYVARCRQDGAEVRDGDIVLDKDVVGTWQPIEQCYDIIETKRDWTDQFDLRTGATVKRGKGGYHAEEARGTLWSRTGIAKWPHAVGRPRGSLGKTAPTKVSESVKAFKAVNASEEEVTSATPEDNEDGAAQSASENESPPAPKGPRGRPRKRPLEEGVLTYYDKRKLEDAERQRLGMPPRQKGWTSAQFKADRADFTARQEADRIQRGLPARAPEPLVEKKSKRMGAKSASKTSAKDVSNEATPPSGETPAEDDQFPDHSSSDGAEEAATMLGLRLPASRPRGANASPTSPQQPQAEPAHTPRSMAGDAVGRRGRPRSGPVDEQPGSSPKPAGRRVDAIAPSAASKLEVEPVVSPVVKRGRGRPRKDAYKSSEVQPSDPRDEPDEPQGTQQTQSSSATHAQLSKKPVSTPQRTTRSTAASSMPEEPATPSRSVARKRTRSGKDDVDSVPTHDASLGPPNLSVDHSDAPAEDEAPPPAAALGIPSKKRRVDFSLDEPSPPLSARQESSQRIERRVSQVLARPSIAARQAATSRATPAHSPTSATVHSSQQSRRPSLLITTKRRAEILSYIEHVGGIVEPYFKLNQAIKDFVESRSGDHQGGMMDRKHLNSLLSSLVDRGSLRHLIAQSGGVASRVEIFYLPSIDVDGPQMRDFLATISSRPGPNRGKVANLRSSTETALINSQVRQGYSLGHVQPRGVPAADSDGEVIRDFFRQTPSILGARFGVYYGRYARARHFHSWLWRYLSELPDTEQTSSGLVLAIEPNVVVAHELFEAEMPLGDYLRVVQIPVESEELDDFVQDEHNLLTRLKDLPPSILAVLEPRSAKRRSSLWTTLQELINLELIAPLAPGEEISDDVSLLDSLRTPARIKFATHWTIARLVPLYMFAAPTKPLVDTCTITNGDEARSYWSRLRRLAFPSSKPSPAAIVDATMAKGFALTSPVPKGMTQYLSSTTKWYDQYMLLPDQRRFLARMYRYDRNLVQDSDRTAQLAEDLLAPVPVVEAFWRKLEHRGRVGCEPVVAKRRRRQSNGRGRGGGRGMQRSRRSVKRRRMRAGSGSQSSRSDNGDLDQAEAYDARQALLNKANDAEAQRARDFDALLQRFRLTHSNAELDLDVVAYVKKRFCAAGRHAIDLRQVELELRALLPTTDVDYLDPSLYKSSVPHAVISVSRASQDPYAIPRSFKSMRRKPKGGAKAMDVGVVNAQTADAHAALPEGSASLAHNPQNEFLAAPAREVPNVASGHRLPRNFMTEDQIDLLFDCVAILKARAAHLQRKLFFTPLAQVFPAPAYSKLRQIYVRRIETSPADSAYFDRLQASWAQTWLEHGGDLPDPNPTDPVDFDLVAFVRFLRQHVDKRALAFLVDRSRLGAPVAKSVTIVELPETLEELDAKFKIDTSKISTSAAMRWDEFWSRSLAANMVREREAANVSFAIPCKSENVPEEAGTDVHRFNLARGVLKMILATPRSVYSEETAKKLLAPFELVIDQVVAELLSNQVISRRSKDSSRRGPGRNFVFSDRFLADLEEPVTPHRLRDAQHTEQEFVQEEASILPLDVSDGAMMALVRVVSLDLAALEIDTSPTQELRDPDDYQTRSKDDEAIECQVNVTIRSGIGFARPTTDDDSTPLCRPHSGYTDDATELAKALDSLNESMHADVPAALELLGELVKAGCDGLSATAAVNGLSIHPDVASFERAARVLVSTAPPLAFWAGVRAPTLVASQELACWCVRLAKQGSAAPSGSLRGSQEDSETLGPFIFPALWVDIRGETVPSIWTRVAAWVRGLISQHAGATILSLISVKSVTTQSYLAAECESMRLLTFIELMTVIETLEQKGLLQRRPFENDIGAASETGAVGVALQPGWAEARWYLGDKWY
ncbi:BQ2448_6944 [Microbotryum intermedium]|uniref:BQ2448_6944 protein n=1 Tax=Microbotryum intermedium TaxID=269621 RepID=A0A238FJP8_9BASI|nr:BQ2448_6944 [Microbotryum intermedium]